MAFMGHIREANPLALPRLLDMVAGQVVIVRPPAEAPPGLRPVGAYGESTVYTNPSALPRAYTVGSARFVATEAAALDAIQAPGFDPRREVVLVGTAEDGLAPEAAGAEGPGAARIVRDEVERIEIEVGPTAPAVLVLADAFAPGWQAFVDGSPRRLWQANHLLRGVLVRPGDERVRFVYEPPGWRLGWAVCGGGWLVAALALAVARSSG
jgi:hypothetical protein